MCYSEEDISEFVFDRDKKKTMINQIFEASSDFED